MQNITLKDLLEMGAHFGHKKELSHPRAQKFVYTTCEGINIINLEKTIDGLNRASKFLANLSKNGQNIVFVGTKRQAKNMIKKAALDCGMPYVNSRWLGGSLTNFETIKKRITSYKKLKKILEGSETKDYTKKERVKLEKEVAKLDKFFLGLKDLENLPDTLFIVDPVEEHVALKEAKIKKIPVVSLCNTNVDVSQIDYPIPANDNAPKTIEYICNFVSNIIKKNKKMNTKSSSEKTEENKIKGAA